MPSPAVVLYETALVKRALCLFRRPDKMPDSGIYPGGWDRMKEPGPKIKGNLIRPETETTDS